MEVQSQGPNASAGIAAGRASDKKKFLSKRLPEAGAPDASVAPGNRSVFSTGATCLFMQSRQQLQLLRLNLMHHRTCRKSCVAKSHFYVPELGDGQSVEIDKLPLYRSSWNPLHEEAPRDVIGEVDIVISLHVVAKVALQSCLLALGVTSRRDALLAKPFAAPLVCGSIVDQIDANGSPSARQTDAANSNANGGIFSEAILEGRRLTEAATATLR
jgi:hypothetical protein